eukprot:TRINITY_DN28268_c0_g1_i1.p1 TRINITY_DN28268_c0_g1~~TRINITY_DN28268_c0_g1_i1.p1  ORF type:complete len:413 (-),score=64.40 TRINITY_DN28268_c0_g1_i1:92-1255(-)
MEIRVRGFVGYICSLQRAQLSSRVDDIKAKIKERTGIPCCEQRLVYDGKVLRDGARRLRDFLLAWPVPFVELTLVRADPDRSRVMDLLAQGKLRLDYLAKQWRYDPEAVMGAMRDNGHMLLLAADALKADADIVLAACRSTRGQALRFAAETLRRDRHFVLQAIACSACGACLEFASEELRGCRAVVRAAVKADGRMRKAKGGGELGAITSTSSASALQFASAELRGDAELVRLACKFNGLALQHASASACANRGVVMTAIRSCAEALRYASMTLRNDRRVVLCAVKHHGQALEHASADLRASFDVVSAAVCCDAGALEHAHESLRCNRDIVLEAFTSKRPITSSTLHLVPDSLQRSRSFWLSVLLRKPEVSRRLMPRRVRRALWSS